MPRTAERVDRMLPRVEAARKQLKDAPTCSALIVPPFKATGRQGDVGARGIPPRAETGGMTGHQRRLAHGVGR